MQTYHMARETAEKTPSAVSNRFPGEKVRQLTAHRFTPPFLACIMLLLLFAGCANSTTSSSSPPSGSSPQGSTPTQSATQATNPPLTNLSDYCNLVSLAEVSQITGLAITKLTTIPDQAQHKVVCGYAADISASTGAVIAFLVPPDAAQAQAAFNAVKQQAQSGGATVADLSGIGDMAFSTTQKGVDGVVVLKGSVVILVSGTTPHPLPLTVDKPLAQLVASKL